MNARLSLQCFGGFHAEVGGKLFQKTKDRKEELLLAYLAFRKGGAVDRNVIANALWPESEGDKALKNLRRTLTALRKGLGAASELLMSKGRTQLQLDIDSADIDFVRFDEAVQGTDEPSLEMAINLHVRPLLEGWEFADAEWVVAERGTRQNQCMKALAELFRRASNRQDYAQAREYLRRLDVLGSIDEGLWRFLIERYIDSQQLSAAWQVYIDLEAALKRVDCALSQETTNLLPYIRQPANSLPALTVLEARLPLPRTRFFGREREFEYLQERIVGIVGQGRLVTVTGLGGTGKTRLALELARQLCSYFAGRIWFVPLENLHRAEDLSQMLLRALGLRPSAGGDAVEQVIAFLNGSDEPVLLILDNFEHLPAECAHLVSTLLSHVARLTCLITSRRKLGLPEESLLLLKPLSVPEQREEFPGSFPSLALFLDRAQKVIPGFQMTDDNRSDLVALCRRLEGLPLALEIAAARLSVKTLAQMLVELDRQFRLLEQQRKVKCARHRSLQAVFQWSYDLLSPEWQRLFARLSVFTGGCNFEAARSVCHNPATLDGLDRLYQCSLLVLEEANGERRWRMLESVRHYAQEQLGAEEVAKYRRRHFSYFWVVAKRVELKLSSVEQSMWFDKLEIEHDNLRAALNWAQEVCVSKVLRLGGVLWRFWQMRGFLREGREYLEGALEKPMGSTSVRRRALTAAGNLAWPQGDYEAMRRFNLESLALAVHPQDKGVSLNNLGLAAWEQCEYEAAQDYFQQSLAIDQEFHDELGMMITLGNLGALHIDQADYITAQQYLRECLKLARHRKNKQVTARALNGLGLIAHKLLKYPRAAKYFEQSIALKQENKDRRGEAASQQNLGLTRLAQGERARAGELFYGALRIRRDLEDKQGIAESLEGIAYLALAEGEYAYAATLFGAASNIRQEIVVPIPWSDNQEHSENIRQVQNGLAPEEFQSLWKRGVAMSVEEVTRFALSSIGTKDSEVC